MNVFTVVHGECCEGGYVVSVHATRKKAVKAAMAVKCCFPGGWVREDEDDYWENGCDFVKVEKKEVE